jgi:protein O-GlcNAc transferase
MNKPGRNEACPCGSGKKYKQCCMLKEGNNPVVVTASPEAPTLPALLQAGLSHHQAGRLADAETFYRQILQREPKHADALHLLGVIAYQAGDHPLAIDLIRRAIAANPSYAAYHSNLGRAYQDNGEPGAAIASYRVALTLQPDLADAHNNLGNALQTQRDLPAALHHYRRALALQPDYAAAHNNLGRALAALGQFDAALHAYRAASALKPDDADVYNNLGIALQEQGQLDAAIEQYRLALALKPDYAPAHNNLGKDLAAQGKFAEAMDSYRTALRLKPDFSAAHSNLLFHLNHEMQPVPALYLAEARRFGTQVSLRARPFETWKTWPSGQRQTESHPPQPLRVGLVSGDLRSHPVGYFLESVLAHLDPRKIELVAYDTRGFGDDLSARIRPYFAQWHILAGLSDEVAAHTIHRHGIAVLVDLAGHTADNRLPVFAWRPAPVQAAWLGYFASTGVASIDYIVADRQVLPAGEEAHFTEKPWCLPDCYLCFTPPDAEIAVGPLPLSENRHVTFGCFNKLNKINDAVVALWAEVLHAVPASRLLLKTKELTDSSAQELTRARFAAHGIDPARLTLEGYTPRLENFAAYRRVDIALDPFPYPGGTTTVEALWMGVPVLSRRGDRFLSHAGESLLSNAGLPDWIADNDVDYIAKAQAFAADPAQLAALRAGLRARLLASPLCDAPRFAAHLAAAFTGMWQAQLTQSAHPTPAAPHQAIP